MGIKMKDGSIQDAVFEEELGRDTFRHTTAHIFMTPEQIPDEIKGVVRLIDEVYSSFGFKYHVELSTRPNNSIGRTWQCGTIQLDFQLPQRFDAEYIGEDRNKHRPIMAVTGADKDITYLR